MRHKSTRWISRFGFAIGITLWGTSLSHAQCMPGGGTGGVSGMGMGPRGGAAMGGPTMGTMSAGSALMSVQQTMHMAQMAQQVRHRQWEQMRMAHAQRIRMTQQQNRQRSGRTTRRQVNSQIAMTMRADQQNKTNNRVENGANGQVDVENQLPNEPGAVRQMPRTHRVSGNRPF